MATEFCAETQAEAESRPESQPRQLLLLWLEPQHSRRQRGAGPCETPFATSEQLPPPVLLLLSAPAIKNSHDNNNNSKNAIHGQQL